ncbi:calcium/sodium antiporter [Salipaludibacillus agaradhaerens]|uniref:calcium/sodium antiporter n=1 Tax=Salipaludibacillus agaradhaerens TaxID=76935 RepID=UPI0021512E8D|nr:calcium/sodium antiporter [Salipaludibacillus agaradhaerens]MCR6105756.1 calcium/sodium antiporter [Salipaludibacillus agaradhaerens]MCR6117792.1 calcium/sodium antiporter [Salipaludibacillus agaradhaerens]UJW56959.1 calcium/sodium antiporter [Bacillus sp. A116_S68]
MVYVLLLLGFALLIKGADWFVTGASDLAAFFNVSPMLVGLTIVAFGTGAPEATVSIIAALEGNPGVTIGNVIGSNIINIAGVVGITAIIFPLKAESQTVRKEIPFTVLSSVAILALVGDTSVDHEISNMLSRGDGIILLLFFAIFMYYVFELAMTNRDTQVPVPEKETETTHNWKKSTLYTGIGLGAVILGGYWVVESSTDIALYFGMSETLVGLTVVSIGSSLPEFVTSITAALKKYSDLALGNIVGSCIFNNLFVLGAASIIYPLNIENKIFLDVSFMILLSLVLLVFSRTKWVISKLEGLVLMISYISYLIYIIYRN